MSRRESQVEISGFIDTQYSSGDANRHPKYQEENNNEVDELSKELSEMGCIVDAVKRPPNICVETCVYDSASDDDNAKGEGDIDNDKDKEEDGYSDEFEEDKSDEEESVRTELTHQSACESTSKSLSQSAKLSKSRSSMSSRTPASISGKTDYGSVSVPQTRRVNMSFTNERLREIERHNHILLTKILSARNQRKSSIPAAQESLPRKPVPSAAVMRKKQQRQIDHDNMILLKKIQRAKSTSCSFRR